VASGWISKKEVIMRYFKFLTLMFIFIFFFSCHKKEQVINPNAKDYFPLATGNYWEYIVYHFEVIAETVFVRNVTYVLLRVDNKSIIKRKEFFKINRYNDEENTGYGSFPSQTYYLRVEDEFLLIRGCDGQGNVLIDTLFHSPNIHNGKPWYVKGMFFSEEGLPYQAIYAGEEVVNLRMDSFNCVKINYSIDPNEEPGSEELYFFEDPEGDIHNLTIWYGEDCGIVKMKAEHIEEPNHKYVYEWILIDYYVKKEQ
jgi:hypothetical protein